MASASVHTPLETFLLFQTLWPHTGKPLSFDGVSSELKNNDVLQESDSYNTSRLDADSLKELYLRLLKEEVKLEALGNEGGHDTQGHLNPRKRKLPSPPMETENDAPQYSYLLPRLTKRLYFRYRDHAIKAIEEQERKYRLLQRDIQEINRGEWDARLKHQEPSFQRDSRGTSSIQTLLRNDDPAQEKERVDKTRGASKSPVPKSFSTTIPEVSKTSLSEDVMAQQSVKGLNGQDTAPERQDIPAATDAPPQLQVTIGAESIDTIGPYTPLVSASEAQQAPSTVQDSRPTSQPNLAQNAKLPPPAPRYAGPGYPLASPKLDNLRLPPPPSQPRAGVPPSPSPHPSHPPMLPPDPSGSPIILPPPPGMLRSSGSPNGPLDALADMAGQHHRASPTLPLPRPPHPHGIQQHPVQLPQPRNYAQRAYPYYDSQAPYPVTYHQYGQNPLPPYHTPNHGVVPAYHSSAPSPSQGPHLGNHSQYQSPLSLHYTGYNQSPPFYPQAQVPAQYNQDLPPRFSEHQTPIMTPANRRRPPRPSPINTSASSTKWKNVDVPGSLRPRKSPTPPAPEEISPISERAPSPPLETSQTPSRAPKGKQAKKDAKRDSPGKKTQSGRSQQARAASTASSAVAGSLATRTRSQSLVSHADELSLDTTPAPSRKIKPETPATSARDDDTSITETTADEGAGRSRKSTRRRRETLRGLESMTELTRSTSAKHNKRPSVLEEPPAPLASPGIRPNQVLGSRNFPRTSATVMNDITAHKLASMFAKPLTEREAPGYKDLIYRPQDLKSIKSAIAAGARAVASAADNINNAGASSSAADGGAGDAGSPSGAGTAPMPTITTKSSSSSTLWLPAREDVIPPKGIVNSAQLEKELMRMFANAVMFNPDPKRGVGPAFRARARLQTQSTTSSFQLQQQDVGGGDDAVVEDGGVVHDTREMCREVERRASEWRAAEMKGRRMEDVGDADELAGEEGAGPEEGGGGGAKRRRR